MAFALDAIVYNVRAFFAVELEMELDVASYLLSMYSGGSLH